MNQLGDALRFNGRVGEALVVYRALTATMRRTGYQLHGNIYLDIQEQVSSCLEAVGRIDDGLEMRRASPPHHNETRAKKC